MKEIWKIAKKSNIRLWEVSNIGRRKITSLKTNKIIKLDFGLGFDGNYKTFGRLGKAHRVIAQVFIPNPENKPQVNHIDGNRSNNRVDNLEWTTASENTRHSFEILGKKVIISDETKIKLSEAISGEKHYMYNPNAFIFINEKESKVEELNVYDMSNKYLINRGSLWRVCRKPQYSVKGWRCIACLLPLNSVYTLKSEHGGANGAPRKV